MFRSAWWVGLPKGELARKEIFHGDLNGRFACYLCRFPAQQGAELEADITASSRYRLWVNGHPVCSGPCKGDLHRWYADRLNLTGFLVPGENVIAVQVLFADHYGTIYQEQEDSPIFSVVSPGGTHRLAFEGRVKNPDGSTAELTTGLADWRCWLDASRRVKNQEPTIYMGAACERIDFSACPGNWKSPDFCPVDWGTPEKIEPVLWAEDRMAVGLVPRFSVQERPIPPLYERECDFSDAGALNAPVTIPAGSSREFLLDAGAETNGFPQFSFRGGKGSRIRITYFEKFTGPNASHKNDPRGEIAGITDELLLSGEELCFEPFWYRAFRFVLLQAEADAELTVFPPKYRKTGYPLRPCSEIHSETPWVEEVYNMCLRTLENCMMDTYMDCPFYEQNQFPMDTRLQALFCSAVSGDMRLTCKALEDFHCSMTPEGLVQGRYPASYQQIISTFSMHYIYMLEETWQQTGDLALIRRYLPDLDRILDYYQARIGSDGLVGRLGWWEFVDWQDAWGHCFGIPEALLHGPSTIINLMYALALERGAVLWQAAGRNALAEEYRSRKSDILRQVRLLCYDKTRGMLREGPSFAQFTQHAQAYAVLTGLFAGEEAKAALRHAQGEDDVLKCTFAAAFEWFRAMEEAGLYAETEPDILRWAALPALGNTTCPEVPENSRSECHAWSALPLYEFLRVCGGIRMEQGAVVVAPQPNWLKSYQGTAWVPGGRAEFALSGGKYTVRLPDGTRGILRTPDGTTIPFTGTAELVLE